MRTTTKENKRKLLKTRTKSQMKKTMKMKEILYNNDVGVSFEKNQGKRDDSPSH